MSRHTIPGLIDVHVHLRIPGGTHKETLQTGTSAALAGGVTALLAMPNTSPPITSRAEMLRARELHQGAYCDLGIFYGATDDNAAEIAQSADLACGLKIYLNDTFGPLRVETLAALRSHFEVWPAHKPIVLHAEKLSVAEAIGMSATYGKPVHIAHVSRGEEIRLIAAAKEAGLAVTCEVAPHHLFLCAEDFERLGPYGDMRPRLASPEDRATLWEFMEFFDCIATDHAPHTRDEKESGSPPPGVPGLETTLPLMLTAVEEGRLSLERLIELTSERPAELFGIRTPAESEVDIEIGPRWTLPERGWFTQPDWSAFAGMEVAGRVLATRLRGETVYEKGRILASAGTGQVLFEQA